MFCFLFSSFLKDIPKINATAIAANIPKATFKAIFKNSTIITNSSLLLCNYLLSIYIDYQFLLK